MTSRGWGKKSKYRARPTTIDGIRFASRKEALHYCILKKLEIDGAIKDLQMQIPFKCVVAGKLVCTYICDFVYWDVEGKRKVYCDVKGYKTPVYRIKKKLVEAIHKILIEEV